jgi:copper chaperone CopZ
MNIRIKTIKENDMSSKIILTLLAFNLVIPAWAGLKKVEQSIYGMDCAPCAFGAEKGLKKLEGVKDVKVSLNEGKATIELAPDNEVKISEIRSTIQKAGFTPKEAQVEVTGKFTKSGEKAFLATESGTKYALSGSDKISSLREGSEILLKGVVPENEPTKLQVKEVSTQQAEETK